MGRPPRPGAISPTPESSPTDHRAALRLASTWTIHQAAAVVGAAYHMAGATAVFRANKFERRFRDMHAIAQQIQAPGHPLRGRRQNDPDRQFYPARTDKLDDRFHETCIMEPMG